MSFCLIAFAKIARNFHSFPSIFAQRTPKSLRNCEAITNALHFYTQVTQRFSKLYLSRISIAYFNSQLQSRAASSNFRKVSLCSKQ